MLCRAATPSHCVLQNILVGSVMACFGEMDEPSCIQNHCEEKCRSGQCFSLHCTGGGFEDDTEQRVCQKRREGQQRELQQQFDNRVLCCRLEDLRLQELSVNDCDIPGKSN